MDAARQPAQAPRRILCLHQGYELYGSDRSFISCVAALRERWPEAEIVARIPHDGEIRGPLEEVASRVEVKPMWILRKKELLQLVTIRLPQLIGGVWGAMRDAREFDKVYVNTVVVLEPMIASMFTGKRFILHAREIPSGVMAPFFRNLVWLSGADAIYNSNATAKAFSLYKRRLGRVVYNGVGDASEKPLAFEVPMQRDVLRILCVGRLNSWKGQDMLIRAIGELSEEARQKVAVKIVGAPFEGQPFDVEFKQIAQELGVADRIDFEGFHADATPYFKWADVVAAPSKSPEPFGRVAIEAMSFSKPVIATNHGGLAEIVRDGETGFLVEPNNPKAIADAILKMGADDDLRTRMGAEGRRVYEELFSETALSANFHRAWDEISMAQAR